MKKIILVFSLLAVFAYGKSQDQPQRPSMEEHLKKAQERLQQELQMTDAQKQKVDQAFKDFMTAAEKIHKENPSPPPPPMDPKVKEALDKLEQQRDTKIKMVLTDAQYKKFLELEKKMHPPHPPMDDKRMPPSKP